MNFNNILETIEKVDPEVYDKLDTRRSAMKQFASFGSKVALAAIPLAIGSMFRKVYAGGTGTNDTVVEILNYALTLEYLEAEFYVNGLNAGNLIPNADARQVIQLISKHENAHVAFLKSAITAVGGTPVAKPTFDFTAGGGSGTGPFSNVFTNFETFLNVAQTFEDTGVRAYKGRAAELVGGGDYLTAALRIHSVEARHAARIRMMRKEFGSGIGNVKPWITLNQSGINSSLVQPSYNGEENTKQAGIEIVNINGTGITANAASEAFDEPLSKAQVLAIVGPFIKP
ncbi:MAG: ferritin-like domain-containing protein [Gemmatimonadaceae bacterium]|nr:ferritin-like domain-containing protein [Chitinophagaceae bacterium]